MPGLFISPGHSASGFVGVQRVIKPVIPAPGAEFVWTLPGGSFWRILSARIPFTASAVVANRLVRFQFSDGTDIFHKVGIPAPVTASLAVEFTLLPLVTLSTTFSLGATGVIPIPDAVLPGGFVLSTLTAGSDAGDQWGQGVLLVEEIDNGPLGNQFGLQPYDAQAAASAGE